MIYQWRYQLPTDVVRHSPGRARTEAERAAIRDARHDGWHKTAPAAVRMSQAFGLENVTDVTVAFAVAREVAPQDVHTDPERFPIGPLQVWLKGRDVRTTFGESLTRTFYRGVEQGWLTLDGADKLTLALGLSIESVWPSCDVSWPVDTLDDTTERVA